MQHIQYIGTLDKNIIEEEFGKLQTEEVVLTSERRQHIKDHHPNDVDLFEEIKECVLADPDLILKDEKQENTIFIIKHIDETNMNIIVKLAIVEDVKHTKNSIMTAYRMRDKNVKKLAEKNKTLYKAE